MSSRRQLVSRARHNEASSPAQRSRNRNSDAGTVREPTALPPYEPPSCPLSASATRALGDIRLNHDYSKYKRHLDASVDAITNAAGDSNERLTIRRSRVKKNAEKRRNQGTEDGEKTQKEEEDELMASQLEKKVGDLTSQAEKALRDLIDYRDELAMQDTIMREVGESIAAAPAEQPSSRGQNNADEDEDDTPAAAPPILSAVELLKKAKQDYSATYASKSMRDRYDNNDYKQFKRTVHDALHPGEDAPPLPHARTWFSEDNTDLTPRSKRRRQANTTDNTNNDDDDDDVIIARATKNLKCPLTLQLFKEPYSNHVCNHTFEKSAILEYHQANAVAFMAPSQPRGRGQRPPPGGARQVKCPQTGCEAMLGLKDFYEDQLLLRQVKRSKKQAATAELDDEEEDDYAGPRGTQSAHPEQIDDDDDDDEDDVDAEEDRRQTIARIKRERQQSRGPSLAPRHGEAEEEDDDEDDDEDEIEDLDAE